MANSSNPLKAYKETQIKTASQGKLIIMLYDGAIRQIDIAVSRLESDTPELDNVNNALVKAQDLITELMVSLDFERGGEIAQRLFHLYMYFNRQLVEANMQKDPKPIKDVRRMVAELCSAWAQIINQGGGSPDDGNGNGGGVNIAG